jgi:hypothetical protein
MMLEVDIQNDRPLGDAQRCYATVLSAYCADCATADLDVWQVYMRRLVLPWPPPVMMATRSAKS